MNINLDDPKLTAYALDELTGQEKAEVESAVSASPEAQEFVRELRLLSGNLRAEYAVERETPVVARRNVIPVEKKRRTMEPVSWLGLAAAVVVCASLVAVAIGTLRRGGSVAALASSPRYAGKSLLNQPAQEPASAVDGIIAEESPDMAPPPPPPANEPTEFALQKPAAPFALAGAVAKSAPPASLYAARQRSESQPVPPTRSE